MWEIVKQGVPQGSVLGLLLFKQMSVKHVSKAILFADDTSVIVNDKDHDSFKQKTNLALTSLNQWFYINHLVLNNTKTNVIKFTPKTTAHVPLDIYYTDNVIDEVKSTKFLGMHIDNHMNWKNHVEQILPKLSAACFSIRNLIHTLNHSSDTRNKNHFYLPVVSLSCVQKRISYSGAKTFNSLPSNIQSFRTDRKRFKNKLYRYIIIHSFYSITEFLECKIEKDNI